MYTQTCTDICVYTPLDGYAGLPVGESLYTESSLLSTGTLPPSLSCRAWTLNSCCMQRVRHSSPTEDEEEEPVFKVLSRPLRLRSSLPPLYLFFSFFFVQYQLIKTHREYTERTTVSIFSLVYTLSTTQCNNSALFHPVVFFSFFLLPVLSLLSVLSLAQTFFPSPVFHLFVFLLLPSFTENLSCCLHILPHYPSEKRRKGQKSVVRISGTDIHHREEGKELWQETTGEER